MKSKELPAYYTGTPNQGDFFKLHDRFGNKLNEINSKQTTSYPWDIGHHDSNIQTLFDDEYISKGSILEIGCGTGNDARWLAKKGFNVTAIDISEEEIANAKEKDKIDYSVPIIPVTWVVGDIYTYSPLKQFDIVYDRGCIHHHNQMEGERSLETLFSKLHSMLNVDGKIVMLTGNPNDKVYDQYSLDFGHIDQGPWRPPVMYISDIEKSSEKLFNIKVVKEIIFEQSTGYDNFLGWMFILKKKRNLLGK